MSKESPKAPPRRPPRVFYGWWIVIASLVAGAIQLGTFSRGFSLYFQPIQKDLALSSARYSLAQTIGSFLGGVTAPSAGYLIDRLGPGTMMVAAGTIMGLGFLALPFANNYLYFLLVFVGLLTMGSRLGLNNAASAALNHWFRRKRSLAMSILSTGQGIAGVVVLPLVTLMVTGLGWKTSAFVSGIAILVIAVPLSMLVRRSPEGMGLLPDGDLPEMAQARLRAGGRRRDEADPETSAPGPLGGRARQTPTDPDFSVGEAVKTPTFWLFGLAQGLREVALTGVQWHLARLIVMSGVSLRTAGFFMSFMSFGTFFFNPLAGWMGDQWVKQRISAIAMVTGGASMLVLLYSNGELWLLAIFVTLLAFSETSNPLNWAITGDFFGRRSYATLRGLHHLPSSLMSMASPVWMGLVFDRTGSFTWALIPLAIVYGLAAFFYWTIPRPKIPVRPSQPSSPSETQVLQGP